MFYSLVEESQIRFMEGTIVSNPTITAKKNFYKCTFKVDSASVNENLSFSTSGTVTLLFPVEMVESHYPKKLYSTNKNPNDIIVETGSRVAVEVSCIDSESRLFSVKNAHGLGWKNKISFFRANCRLNFKRLLAMWGEAGGFVLALLAASKEYLDEKIQISFCLAGLSHIMALSGMHVGIFSGFTKKISKPLLGERFSNLLSVIAVILFVWFAGFSPSLTRALIGCLIAYISTICCIKIKSLTSLSLAFLIQILIFPSDFSSVSFMLSYMALLGIVVFSDFFNRFLCRFTGTFLANQLSPSVSAILMTSPISAKIWGFVTPIGVLSSMVISPLVTCFLIMSLIFIILSLIFPFLTIPLGKIVQILYYAIKYIGIFFAKFPPISIGGIK